MLLHSQLLSLPGLFAIQPLLLGFLQTLLARALVGLFVIQCEPSTVRRHRVGPLSRDVQWLGKHRRQAGDGGRCGTCRKQDEHQAGLEKYFHHWETPKTELSANVVAFLP